MQKLVKMGSTGKKKNRKKWQLSKLNEKLNDFRKNTNMSVTENENLEQEANGCHRDSERIVDNASQNPVIGNNTVDRIRAAVDCTAIVVENRVHDVILTALKDVVIPQFEMAVRPITRSSRNGPNSIVQNPHRRDYTRITKNTPLRSASTKLDLNIDRDIYQMRLLILIIPKTATSRHEDSMMTRERMLYTW